MEGLEGFGEGMVRESVKGLVRGLERGFVLLTKEPGDWEWSVIETGQIFCLTFNVIQE